MLSFGWRLSQYTLYIKKARTFKRHKVLSRGIGYQYQADLVDYSALKRDNLGFTFVLTIIDVFSHVALALPIKSKSGPKVAAALEKAFHVLKSPKKLQTNLGKEFYNKHVQDLLKRNKVHHFSTDQPLKASLVEQFNRTLRETMKQSMAYRKNLRYIDMFCWTSCMVTMPGLTVLYFLLPLTM